ncbi:hypothetical protein TNCV_128641 [Trichonephila clavipes]|nr:hypothetical protein TNCV_128641 [Trichonephila clavipes]
MPLKGLKNVGLRLNHLVFSEHDFAATKSTAHDVVGDETNPSANPQNLVVENQHINPPEEPELMANADYDALKKPDTFQRLIECLITGFELITDNCQSLEERIARHMGQRMRPLEDAGKNGWVHNGRFQHHNGSGRPRATAGREDRLVVKSAVKAPDSLVLTIGRTNRTRVSIMTIHR